MNLRIALREGCRIADRAFIELLPFPKGIDSIAGDNVPGRDSKTFDPVRVGLLTNPTSQSRVNYDRGN